MCTTAQAYFRRSRGSSGHRKRDKDHAIYARNTIDCGIGLFATQSATQFASLNKCITMCMQYSGVFRMLSGSNAML